MQSQDYPIMLGIQHIKEILGIGNNQAYDLVKNPDFPSIKGMKPIRVHRDLFFKWLEEQSKPQEIKRRRVS
jgi:hypothetical protein